MKIAIKVLTEWDRENVISFFEKHYPNCNFAWHSDSVEIGNTFWVRKDGKLFADDEDRYATPSDYTILQGVPQNMELPKYQELQSKFTERLKQFNGDAIQEWIEMDNERKVEPIKTREQELEECLREIIHIFSYKQSYPIPDMITKIEEAKQLLNK